MSKLKDSYEVRLRCATCGCEEHFESNEDKSYIKCTFCNREYLGGIEELKEFNQEAFDEVNKDYSSVRSILQRRLNLNEENFVEEIIEVDDKFSIFESFIEV